MQSVADINRVSRIVLDCAFAVHSSLGPGLLESAYQACLAYELRSCGRLVLEQVPMPLIYKELRLDCAYRLDIVVDDSLVIELKAVTQVLPVHEAQLLTYLRLSRYRLGLLINFNTPLLRDGIRRIANGM